MIFLGINYTIGVRAVRNAKIYLCRKNNGGGRVKRTAILLIILGILALSLTGTGCKEEEITPTTTPTIAPTATLPATPTITPLPVTTPTAAPPTIPTATPGPTTIPSGSPAPTPIALFLTVTQPLDGAQVSTSSVLVVGTTNPGAVVSVLVDDEVTIADVDQNGGFSAAVSLEEGPNFIEVIASDQQGGEKSSTIAVIYVP